MSNDVKSATVRAVSDTERAMFWRKSAAILRAEWDLEVVLEGGARTGASGERCIEMTQVVRVGKSVGFPGRVTH